jgi:nucleoside-diphosphate-sugar epimerase
VVYAAVNETPGDLVASWTDPHHAERNGQMFRNLFDIALSANRTLRHVSVVHGTKAYAVHLPQRRPLVPLRESLPRPPHDDFYFRQEDYLWEKQRGANWSWTIFRAPAIVGGGLGSNLNGLLAMAVFASLRKAVGLSLPFPGSADNLGVMEMVDVELLARAIDWATAADSARNQTFNIANGDVYVWPDMWPVIAEEIGLPVGESQPMSLVAAIAAQANEWAQLVKKHHLVAPADWREFLGESAALADFQLNNCARTVLTSTIKIRQAGFHDCVDSATSVAGWIRRWRDEKLIPPR